MGPGRGLRLCPNPGMPEKTLGASGSSSEVGGFPQTPFQPVLYRHHQRPVSPASSHQDSLQSACLLQEDLASLQHTTHRRRGGVLVLAPPPSSLIPFPEQEAGPSSVDLNPGAVAALQMEQRQFPRFNCGNVVFLIYSILGLERIMSRRAYTFPPS